MGKKIKIIYLILGILILLLLIIVLSFWVLKQINFEFFIFDTKNCLVEYVSNKYSVKRIEYMTDEEIELVSQAWNLDRAELFSIRDVYLSMADYYSEIEDICYIKYINKASASGIKWVPKDKSDESYLEYKACINELGIPDFHELENFIKDKELNINRKLKKQLIPKGVCIRPSFLK